MRRCSRSTGRGPRRCGTGLAASWSRSIRTSGPRGGKAAKKPVAEIDQMARGRVWTGAEAFRLGLVDRLGGLEVAVSVAKERAKIGKDQDVQLVILPEKKGFLETLLERQDEGLEASLPADLRFALRWSSLLGDGKPLARLPFDLQIR